MTDTRALPGAEALLAAAGDEISLHDLQLLARRSGNSNFIRYCNEYLPLTFSRRHGDPSRPWNQFSH
ncbi:MAG: hypothetical protein U5L72_19415 [Bacteroidales bacterium]|nr:hypothetical protein [Bacteroidales bacterium]